MTKKEVKRLLYSFLMKNGLLVQYYYSCIYHQTDYTIRSRRVKIMSLPKKQRLNVLFDDVFDEYLLSSSSKKLDGFFNFRTHTFTWDSTPEGYKFWDKMYLKWENYVNNHGYEYKKEVIWRSKI